MNLENNEFNTEKENKEEKSNVYWNQDIEKIVHEIGEKSKSYKIMHIKEAKSISFIYDLLMYSGIILGPIAGLLSAIGSILSPDTSPSTLPIISGCVAFFSGIVVAITKYGKFEEKNSHHKMAASKYTSLESNIRRQLILYRDNRQNAEKYLEWIGNSFDDLFSASPLISDRIYDEYIKIARKKGLLVPDDYVININNHKINESIREIQNVSSLKKDEVLNNISHFPDINKFSDNMMSYELQRMMK
uniref:SMODS and SLOG-associating 2TM effector domain-containing protein n=1 Tax=viral metagenome TaxID=1070528 RepID=A0A6C0JJC8_9ZZZZ